MMLEINTWVNDDCTIGRLRYGDFKCLTLELPWRENEPNVSCVPAGTYDAIKYDSPKHGEVVLLKDVPHRSFVEIHSGNYTRQILGCILAGESITYLDDDDILDVTNSKATMKKLLRELPDEFQVKIARSS